MTGGPEKNLVGGDKEASLLRPELSLNFAVQRSFKLAPLSPLAGSSTKLVIAAYRKTPTFGGFLLPPFFSTSLFRNEVLFISWVFSSSSFYPSLPLSFAEGYSFRSCLEVVRCSTCSWLLTVTNESNFHTLGYVSIRIFD